MTKQKPYAHIILCDNQEQIKELRIRLGEKRISSEPHGLGYARGIEFHSGTDFWIALYLSPANAESYLHICISQLANRFEIKSILGTASGLSLSEAMSPGHICRVNSCISTAYPALYENIDPYAPRPPQDTIALKVPNPNCRLPDSYKILPQVCAGSCRHPHHNGALMPWSPDQWKKLNNLGISIYSEFPVGIARALEDHPVPSWQLLGVCVDMASKYKKSEMISHYSEAMSTLILQWIAKLSTTKVDL